ncbi:thioredoxin-dependent thiol peroxidase [Candidatus Woesearchaeota archaeon]|nr:thioredoxin-dependent thiol peroxidase [Candidatus Woesearchaeota archaeon]
MKIGEKAPDFELKDTNDEIRKLSDYKGKFLVLYFYPKDMTPGCTKEACNLRDNYDELRKKGVEILGVSLDDQNSHKKFTEKYLLPFPLLCDADAKVSKKYGVYKKKNLYGKESYGIQRTTFIIKEGKIFSIINNVDTENHAKQILVAIEP